jgi:hypothetical protein
MTDVTVVVYVPESHLEVVLDALHDAGAGRIGEYDRCASWWPVVGQWRPSADASPYEGAAGEVSRGTELRVEVRCAGDLVAVAVAAARAAHPYEEPVIDVHPLVEPPR